MRAREFTIEALTPSQYRPYVKAWDKTRWADIFGGKYRIYIRIGGESVSADEPDPELIAAIEDAGYEVTDYIQGYAVKKDDPRKQIVKIGKILTDTRFKIPPIIKQTFDKDPARQSSKSENMIVISRHPYDIAGMTSGRTWHSCMNIETGINRRYVA